MWRAREESDAERCVPGAAVRRRVDGAGRPPPRQRGAGGGEGQDEEDNVSPVVVVPHTRARGRPGGTTGGAGSCQERLPAAEPGAKVGGEGRAEQLAHRCHLEPYRG